MNLIPQNAHLTTKFTQLFPHKIVTSNKSVNRVSPHYQLRNPELSVLLYITCFQSKQRRYQGLCEQKQPINPVWSSHGESKVLAGSTVCLCTLASVCLISDVWTSNTTTCPSNGPQRLDRPRFRLFSRLLTKSKPKLPLGWPRFDLFSWDFHSTKAMSLVNLSAYMIWITAQSPPPR